MVSGIQLFGAGFALVQAYFTFLHFKRHEFTIRELLAWESLWFGFGLVTIFPEKFRVYAGQLGTLRALDLFSVIGFIVVLSISFYTYVNLDQLRKKFERAVREMALSDLSETEDKKPGHKRK